MCNTVEFDEGRLASKSGKDWFENPYDAEEDLGEDYEIGERRKDWLDGWISYRRENDIPGHGV